MEISAETVNGVSIFHALQKTFVVHLIEFIAST